MARDEELRRVEVGFAGGQAISLRAHAEGIREPPQGRSSAEAAGPRSSRPDGIVSVNLGAVVFVKLDTGEHRVGFSGL